MNKKIVEVAETYQKIDRQIKDLQSKQKPLKKQLIDYAEEHKSDFDEAFQLKFPNGTYISQRVSDVIEGSNEAKKQLLEETEEEYAEIKLNEKAVLEEAPKNSRLRKLLTKLGLKVAQKETFAVYAG
ncbi:host-nuclease inhibitor Gam family protein [Riemerella anatipestifer]|nr:host-nuclease inhibitor Gam family protein [Riemerella anatipestifer]WPC13448.1 host-nuclease inhibitor Gam family protein [Riemerella anatipestifer]